MQVPGIPQKMAREISIFLQNGRVSTLEKANTV
jgi:hypothetical protein